MGGRAWTPEEIEAVLAASWGELPALAARQGRTQQAVVHKRYRLRNAPRPEPPAPRLCSVSGCGRRHAARGFCNLHYERLRRHGTTTAARPLNRRTAIVKAARDPAEPSEAGRRRGEVRRAIEDLEESLRLRREDQLLCEGDW